MTDTSPSIPQNSSGPEKSKVAENVSNSQRAAAPTAPLPPLNELPVDSLLMVSFGGPEGREDVMPFLENVLRGKNVPRERMLEVAEHYYHFGGISPINEQCRQLLAAIKEELARRSIDLPIYWGNRNWNPMLTDTVQQMADDGRRRALTFFTSTFSSYSGCRQYRENIADAQSAVGPKAPLVENVRMGFNHPKFIAAQVDCVAYALSEFPESDRQSIKVLFCAHSIPMSMADNSFYEVQLREAAGLISEKLSITDWELAFQSRSGPPQQPWLEPDVCDRAEQLHAETGLDKLVVVPLGFISDHIEVLFDLDEELADVCTELGIKMVRAKTVGVHPEFVSMIVDLIEERLTPGTDRPCLGKLGPKHDLCPTNCCLYPTQRPAVKN